MEDLRVKLLEKPSISVCFFHAHTPSSGLSDSASIPDGSSRRHSLTTIKQSVVSGGASNGITANGLTNGHVGYGVALRRSSRLSRNHQFRLQLQQQEEHSQHQHHRLLPMAGLADIEGAGKGKLVMPMK